MLTITPTQARELPEPESGMTARVGGSPTVRRAKRFGRSVRDRWDRR